MLHPCDWWGFSYLRYRRDGFLHRGIAQVMRASSPLRFTPRTYILASTLLYRSEQINRYTAITKFESVMVTMLALALFIILPTCSNPSRHVSYLNVWISVSRARQYVSQRSFDAEHAYSALIAVLNPLSSTILHFVYRIMPATVVLFLLMPPKKSLHGNDIQPHKRGLLYLSSSFSCVRTKWTGSEEAYAKVLLDKQ